VVDPTATVVSQLKTGPTSYHKK